MFEGCAALEKITPPKAPLLLKKCVRTDGPAGNRRPQDGNVLGAGAFQECKALQSAALPGT